MHLPGVRFQIHNVLHPNGNNVVNALHPIVHDPNIYQPFKTQVAIWSVYKSYHASLFVSEWAALPDIYQLKFAKIFGSRGIGIGYI